MKKKLPVVSIAERDEAARLAELPAEATVALQDLAVAIKDGLMAFCCSAGLAVVSEIMAAEMTEKAVPKGRHDPERTATRNVSSPGSVVLGGRTVPVSRPRATKTEGVEVHLDSYTAFNDRDLLSQVAVERMLAGVSTRRHALVAEPIGEELEEASRGVSRSAISRRFVAATTEKLSELLASDLSVHDAAVLMIDGIMFHENCCVVALLITADGTKIPVGCVRATPRTPRWSSTCWPTWSRGDCTMRRVSCSSSTLARRWPRALSASSSSMPSCNVAPCTNVAMLVTTSPPSWPVASTASSRRPSTTPMLPVG